MTSPRPAAYRPPAPAGCRHPGNSAAQGIRQEANKKRAGKK